MPSFRFPRQGFGRRPRVVPQECADRANLGQSTGVAGFRIVIFPGGTARFVASQLQRYFESPRAHATTGPTRDSMLDFDELNEVVGTPGLIALGQKYEQ